MAKENSKLVDEAALKADLVLLMRKELTKGLVFRHEDKMTHGIPDISFTGFGRTIWFEVKYEHPNLGDFESPGIQELNMLRLSHIGMARYIVYSNVNGEQRTYIIPPRHIGKREFWGVGVPGFNHAAIVQWIRGNSAEF